MVVSSVVSAGPQVLEDLDTKFIGLQDGPTKEKERRRSKSKKKNQMQNLSRKIGKGTFWLSQPQKMLDKINKSKPINISIIMPIS